MGWNNISKIDKMWIAAHYVLCEILNENSPFICAHPSQMGCNKVSIPPAPLHATGHRANFDLSFIAL